MEFQTVTLTTDLGIEYTAQMKGVLLAMKPDITIVDISHSISAHNILEGAFVLYSAAPYFKNAIHIAVVDPEVGTDRKILVVCCKNAFFVGPDNGLLIPAANRLGIEEVYTVSNKRYFRECVAPTFHGRDIIAPVAGWLAKGVEPAEIGDRTAVYKKLDFGTPTKNGHKIEGSIIYIDKFGNAITNIPADMVAFNKSAFIDVGLHEKIIKLKYCSIYADVPLKNPLLLISSFGFLEIAVHLGSAQQTLNLKPGDTITLHL